MTRTASTITRIVAVAVLLACAAPTARADEAGNSGADEAGFKAIFNGQDLTGWEGKPEFWSVKDGAIVGQTTAENPTRGNTFLIWRDGEVDDFELRLKFRIQGGNSGVQYRSKDLGNFVVGGYQADFEAGDKWNGTLYEEKGRGVLAARGQRVTITPDGNRQQGEPVGDPDELGKVVKKGDWNEYTIIARGNHLIQKINGQLMCEVIDEQAGKRAMSGILALQLHAGPPMTVEFKDIRLKRLKLADGRKKLVMVAGRPSHGPGAHEFNAGVKLLRRCLEESVPKLLVTSYHSGWPNDPTAFDNADAIFLYMDGGSGHPVIQRNRLAEIDALMRQGVGLACAHYAVEVPKEKGGPEFLQWIGGYFEMYWSVNPHWLMQKEHVKLASDHPITRGVEPFAMQDEWYYHMRFREGMEGVTAILSAIPPEVTRQRGDGPHSGNPHVRARSGMPEVLAWAAERPDGGRGFGFTGGHFHMNWGDDNFRKLVLNALVWVSGLEVPPDGVPSTVTEAQLQENLDPKGRR
jgi:type 1 glutamine amidotransferase